MIKFHIGSMYVSRVESGSVRGYTGEGSVMPMGAEGREVLLELGGRRHGGGATAGRLRQSFLSVLLQGMIQCVQDKNR